MKKYLLLILISIIFPSIVFADENCIGETPLQWCQGSTCLLDLQKTYNTWNSNNNTGKACLKVIAQRTGNNKTYINGKNPNTDYKCANGNVPTIQLIASSLPDQENNVSECQSNTCYIPELWAVDCGDSNISNSNTTNSNSSSNLNGNDEINDIIISLQLIGLDLNKKKY